MRTHGTLKTRSISSALIIAAALCAAVVAAESPADEEILRQRRELSRQQVECQRIRADIEKETKDYGTYRTGYTQRVQSVMTGMDSLKRDMTRAARRNDSLAAAIEFMRTGIRQIDRTQENTCQGIIAACVSLEPAVKRLPPLASQNLAASVALLRSDLAARSIDNVEGANRLYTILSQFDEVSGSIQVSQESSPTADIRGSVYRVRVGSFFEALSDEKGEKGAVFGGYGADGSAMWKPVGMELASAVRAAAMVREGKNLPAFARLPLLDTLPKGALK